MGKSCCAIDCKNRFRKNSELSFYRLPKDKEKRNQWIRALRRKNWNPGTEVRLCSCHFVSGKKSEDPLHPDYVPSLFSFTSATARTQAINNLEGYLRAQEVSEKNTNRELAATALLNLHQIKEEEVEGLHQVKEEEILHQVKETLHQVKIEVEALQDVEEPETMCCIKEEVLNVEFQDTEVQTEETHNDIASLHQQIKSLNTECQSLRNKIHKLESDLKRRTLDTSQFDDSKMKTFTGLPNLQTFMLLFSYVSSLHPDTEKQPLKPTQQLLLTLMKLRHNLSEKFLGQLFAVHRTTVFRIFRRWTQLMASKLPEAEFPLLKAAILQHVSPSSPTDEA